MPPRGQGGKTWMFKKLFEKGIRNRIAIGLWVAKSFLYLDNADRFD
jgi:hypothetical protein